jgi:hypothetical protein
MEGARILLSLLILSIPDGEEGAQKCCCAEEYGVAARDILLEAHCDGFVCGIGGDSMLMLYTLSVGANVC